MTLTGPDEQRNEALNYPEETALSEPAAHAVMKIARLCVQGFQESAARRYLPFLQVVV